jgi:hypothetical protein
VHKKGKQSLSFKTPDKLMKVKINTNNSTIVEMILSCFCCSLSRLRNVSASRSADCGFDPWKCQIKGLYCHLLSKQHLKVRHTI